MDGDFGCLVWGIIICVITYIVVKFVLPKFVLPVALGLLGIFGLVGLGIGVVTSIRSFVEAIKGTIAERKGLYLFNKRSTKGIHILEYEEEERKKIIYEENARKSYLLGPFGEDIGHIFINTFANCYSNANLSLGADEGVIAKIYLLVYMLCKAIGIYVIGTLCSIVFCLVLAALALVFSIAGYALFILAFLFETIKFKLKSIKYRCPHCMKEYGLPIYVCPTCKVIHTHLKPGKYGIFKRKCLCGSLLPLTKGSVGKTFDFNDEVQTSYHGRYDEISRMPAVMWKKIRYDELSGICPYCKRTYNAGLSHPLSIAFIGGRSAGKTTFKVAFLKQFLEEETIAYNIDYDFPDSDTERDYNLYKRYFSGMAVPATDSASDNDILTFSFKLRNSKFGADRMIQLYDMPGEKFLSGEVREGWNHYTFSEGAVFLIDPFSLKSVKDANEKHISNNMGICVADMNELIGSFINTLRQVRVKKANNKFAIPIALTINKADTPILKSQIGDAAIRKLMAAHPDVFKDYYATMDYICRCFLARNQGVAFMANLDNNFEYVHFFSCSPMGYVPQSKLTPFKPINVLPIMQWMLLRADKELAMVWKPEKPVADMTMEARLLYKEHPEYYDNVIEKNVTYE